ncbi:MAG TPA: signal peptidase I [Bryobacteraceae bacterium]|jgi:signal peptidase I|nr:signal peptidase I [Bryobacteraceae bacterium]
MSQETATAKLAQPPSKVNVRPEHARNGIAEWAVTILLLLFGTTTLVQAFVIPTGSMEDTLLIGDHLLVDKLAYAPSGTISKYFLPYEQPKHGDIIVFRFPGDISQTFVKRVIGIPGDHIKMVDRVVYRNGAPLYEPYVYHKGFPEPIRDNFPHEPIPIEYPKGEELQRDMLANHVVNGEVVVPPHSYFAMGDNRDDSLDSRYWGFVPRDNIIGKPLLIYWSYRASTEELAGSSIGSLVSHVVDLTEHFFSRTRWDRTLRIIRGFPDSQLATHPLPLNPGSREP